ncbi:MAG: hypothetical protein K6T56_01215 [Burkholderiales bacterium]|jgi:hypothetical protein|nr:hypothetical protein [Burkholderiales bacterium]
MKGKRFDALGEPARCPECEALAEQLRRLEVLAWREVFVPMNCREGRRPPPAGEPYVFFPTAIDQWP